jgi:predicted esterase
MNHRTLRRAAVVAAVTIALARSAAQEPSDAALDKALDSFWKADSAPKALKSVEKIPAASLDFDRLYARLKAGRVYGKAKTGEFYARSTAGVAGVLENRVDVPAEYDPARKWPLRVQLHGGVNRPRETVGGPDIEGEPGQTGGRGGGAPSLARRQGPNRIAGEPQIYVYPQGFAEAQWWQASQVENVAKLVDQVSRRYNVDESHVYLTGISDGATGVYYLATRDATRWSAVMPLNGSILVLNNRDIGVDGEVYANNLVNIPLYIVNGGRDPLYPVAHVQTHIEWFRKMGVTLQFSPQMNAGHDTSWWPGERILYERFVHEHPRDPHPAKLSWETERTDRYNRVRWLAIDALGAAPSDSAIPDAGYFTHRAVSGRVDVERQGNTFAATTRGVRQFRLLLSPDVVDFSRPVTVTVNGRPAFAGTVAKSTATLLQWAARDNDRTMLYAAEVVVKVP